MFQKIKISPANTKAREFLLLWRQGNSLKYVSETGHISTVLMDNLACTPVTWNGESFFFKYHTPIYQKFSHAATNVCNIF